MENEENDPIYSMLRLFSFFFGTIIDFETPRLRSHKFLAIHKHFFFLVSFPFCRVTELHETRINCGLPIHDENLRVIFAITVR